MSHVAQVDVVIQNLDDLEAACRRLGLELVREQQTYIWWGRHVGDYPLPAGFAQEDLGRCEHAIRIPELLQRHGQRPYEIGVVRRRDGRPGYCLLWDFIGGGFGLQEFIGEDGKRLRQAYSAAAATRTMRAQGFRVREVQQADGRLRLTCSK